MAIKTNRRGFLGGALSLAALGAGARPWWMGGETPQLKFGVISDPHLTTPESTEMFRRALVYFRDRGAEAVVLCGDVTDWGLRSGYKYAMDTWNSVFPGDKGADGRPVARLFVTGNHDWDGWWYGDMTLEMHANGYSEDDALYNFGMKETWESAFGEPYAEIRKRMVKDFLFVSSEWSGISESDNDAKVAEWLDAHAAELPKDRPFFFFRHEPVGGTVTASSRKEDPMKLNAALSRFPNCIALAGHVHWNVNDERSIWQDGFTAISVPSLSYTTIPGGHENGCSYRNGKCTESMAMIPARENLQEAQGLFVSVYGKRVEVERRDFAEGVETAAPWIIPLDAAKGRPYSYAEHAARLAVPQFPEGARVRTRTLNGLTRNGNWSIFFELEFPAAHADGGRVQDYEARVVTEDGKPGAVKRFFSPAIHLPERHEPQTLRFLFDAKDVPDSGKYRIEVRPRNCFEKAGRPIRTDVLTSVPGKAAVPDVEMRRACTRRKPPVRKTTGNAK